ncbi:MAG: lytic transglycosylase domain-containing protein [Nocardioidaceae bacterium]
MSGTWAAQPRQPRVTPLHPAAATVLSRAVERSTQVSFGAPPWRVAPQVTFRAKLLLNTKKERNRKVTISSARGTLVWKASTLVDHNLPSAALHAYQHASATENAADPACHIPWTLLAGIGRVESDHGRYAGSVLGTDGISRPTIIGVALNGNGPVAAIPDTDNGLWDHDTVWDHAVGPMQFIPSTWSWAGRDGDGDGVKNPNDINDAALAAAAYLCNGGGDLRTSAGMASAIYRYNPSDYYVALVMAFEKGYRTGAFVIPSPPPPPAATTGHHAHHKAHGKNHANKHGKATKGKHHKGSATHKKHAKPGSKHSTKPSPSGKPSPSSPPSSSNPKPSPKPSPSPTPKPSPKPSPTPSPTPKPSPSPSPTPSPKPSPKPSPSPSSTTITGLWTACGGTWCDAGTALDLSLAGALSATAPADFDGDGTVETNAAEFQGLEGTTVTVVVDGSNVVHELGGYKLG